MAKNTTHHKNDKFHATLNKLREQASAKEMQLVDLLESVYEKAKSAKEETFSKVQDTATSVNNSVHLHPWHYIGGALLGGFLTGLLLGRNK